MSELTEAYRQFVQVVELAERRLAVDRPREAAGLAQVAAKLAFEGHVGIFASPRLERLLLALGRKIAPSCDDVRGLTRHGRRHVLHVLTFGRHIGGDTRFVWRWMESDPESLHSVVITSKGLHGVPDALSASAAATGGTCRMLDGSGDALARARELRGLCREADLVVLHLFPYDIVPALALACDCATPTVFVHHSDHTFRLGGSVAHAIVHLRDQSGEFLKNRRGLDPDACTRLPIPLTAVRPSMGRAEARRMLGYGPNELLLLTIASPFKYVAEHQLSFLDLVVPQLRKYPNARLVAVGPECHGSWQEAHDTTSGQVIPLGARWDNDHLYAAADVYLDSVPLSSITSLLEAGLHGVPALGLDPPTADLALLAPRAPGLDGAMLVARSAEEYKGLLARLIRDAQFRDRCGRRLQAQIVSLHTGEDWAKAVRSVYGSSDGGHPRGCLRATQDEFCETALDSALMDLYRRSGRAGKVSAILEQQMSEWSYGLRVTVAWLLLRRGLGTHFKSWLPGSVVGVMRRAARRLRLWPPMVRRAVMIESATRPTAGLSRLKARS